MARYVKSAAAASVSVLRMIGVEEPAQGCEDRQGAGVQPERRREARDGREGHRHEGHWRPHESVGRVGGIEGQVNDPDPDRHEALGRQAVSRPAGEPHTAGHHRGPRHESRQDAASGPDPLLLEGVLEKEPHTEEQENRTHPARARSRQVGLPTDARRNRARAPERSAGRAAPRPRPVAHCPSRAPLPRFSDPTPPGSSWPGRRRSRAGSPACRVPRATERAAQPSGLLRLPQERRRSPVPPNAVPGRPGEPPAGAPGSSGSEAPGSARG